MMSQKSEGCVSLGCLKYALCIYNFIFLLCGCILLGLGLWTVLEKWEMVLMMPSLVYEITIWLVVATGALSVLIALLGYTAIAFESRHLLAWYTILLVVVFISESVIGLLSYVYQDRLGPDLEQTLTQSFISSYGLDHDRTLAADNIQLKLQCCGSESHLDWAHSAWRTSHSPLLVPQTCLYVCGLSVSIALLQILGTILTSSLFSRLQRREKYSPAPTTTSSWDTE